MKDMVLTGPPGVQVELYSINQKTRAISWGEGRLLLLSSADTDGYSLRTQHGHQTGLVTTTRLTQKELPQLIQESLAIGGNLPANSHRIFGSPLAQPVSAIAHDETILSRVSDDIINELKLGEAELLAADPRIRKVLKIYRHEELSRIQLQNTRGLHWEKMNSRVTVMAEVMAEQDQQTEISWSFRSSRYGADVNLNEVLTEVKRIALQSLGGAPILTGPYPVVIHPRVGCQLLNLVAQALSAEAVQMNRSFLKNHLHKTMASSCVTVIDDPRSDRGVSSMSIDDEGTPTAALTMVESGMLKNYFYDLESASRDGQSSNGHGLKPRLGVHPKPEATNLYVARGNWSLPNLLSSQPVVFYLWDVMGMHMADPITGEFSLGASGLLYKNGVFAQPVRGITVAGRMTDLLKNIQAVGEDLIWYGDRGMPHILVSPMSISGN